MLGSYSEGIWRYKIELKTLGIGQGNQVNKKKKYKFKYLCVELWKVVSVVITTVVITKVVDTTYMYFTQNTVHKDKRFSDHLSQKA